MSQEICNISNSSDNDDPLAFPANIPDDMVYKWLAWYEEGKDGHGGDAYNHKRMDDGLYGFVPPSRHPEYESTGPSPYKDVIHRGSMVLVERPKYLGDIVSGRLAMVNEALKNGVLSGVGRKTWESVCANRGSGRYAEAILQVKPRDIKQIEESAKQIESDKLLIGN